MFVPFHINSDILWIRLSQQWFCKYFFDQTRFGYFRFPTRWDGCYFSIAQNTFWLLISFQKGKAMRARRKIASWTVGGRLDYKNANSGLDNYSRCIQLKMLRLVPFSGPNEKANISRFKKPHQTLKVHWGTLSEEDKLYYLSPMSIKLFIWAYLIPGWHVEKSSISLFNSILYLYFENKHTDEKFVSFWFEKWFLLVLA